MLCLVRPCTYYGGYREKRWPSYPRDTSRIQVAMSRNPSDTTLIFSRIYADQQSICIYMRLTA